jgi:sugar/nucleoside kinase (ribokinase family)
MSQEILCIGSVLWDMIGRTDQTMKAGADKPGRITRLPGGVSMNIAMTLQRFGLRPALLTAIGQDSEGDELIDACTAMGLRTDTVYRPRNLPTDRYMAIEAANGLVAAIADAHSLEQAGDRILAPLTDGRLPNPFRGAVALDGNLTASLLSDISLSPLFSKADLRIAPASPGKAKRLRPFVDTHRGTLYVNLEEAGLLCDTVFTSSAKAAQAMKAAGANRVLVTDGAVGASLADGSEVLTLQPPSVEAKRITGAGDTFMAAHIVSELRGMDRQAALQVALNAAATYVSGKEPECP